MAKQVMDLQEMVMVVAPGTETLDELFGAQVEVALPQLPDLTINPQAAPKSAARPEPANPY